MTLSCEVRHALGLCKRPLDVEHDCAADLAAWLLYSAAERREGPKYAEAIRGAAAMRPAVRTPHSRGLATPNELDYGIPKGWITR